MALGWIKDKVGSIGNSIGNSVGSIIDSGGDFLRAVGRGDIGGAFNDLASIGWEAANILSGGALNLSADAVKRALTPDIPRPDYEDRKTMSRNSDTPYRMIYGRARVGGAVRYIESSGTDSSTLHIICVFAAHSCEAIERIYLNNELAFIGTTAQGKFAGKAVAILEHGKQQGANAQIVAQTPSGWTNDHKLLGMTYAYLRLTYDRDVFQGAPSVSALVKGKDNVRDPRTGDNGWTDNQALCVMDWLRSDYGYNLSLGEIDEDSFAAGATICDQLVVSGSGTTEKRYTANGAFSVIGQPQEALNFLNAAGLSSCQYVQGQVRYIAGNYTAPSAGASFDEGEIWSSVQLIPTTGASDRINIVRGTYLDPAQEYEPVDFVPVSIQQYIDSDKQELTQDAKFPMTTSGTMARRIAKITLERSRFGVRASCTLSWKAFEYSVGDRISLTVAGLGWSGKVFRIEKMQYSLSGVEVELAEDSPLVWAWQEGDAQVVTAPPALNYPNLSPVPAPSNLQMQELLNTPRTDNQDRVTIVLSSDAPSDPRYNVTEYSYRVKQAQNDWVPINYSDGNVSIDLKADGTTYEFRARSVSLTGRVYEGSTTGEYTVYNRRLIGAVTPDLELPAIAGLRLTNNVDGTFDEYKSGNAEFEWQPRSETEYVGFAEDELGADSGQFDLHFEDYRITIFRADGSVALQDTTRDPWYVLTLETNRKYSVGRAFRFGVEARGANGQIGKGQIISVNNPAPAAVTDVSVEYTSEDITISYALPDDLDFIGVRFGGKLYSGNSISIPPIGARSVSLSLVSVDRFGDGATATVTLTNAAPAAPTGVSVTGGVNSFAVSFVPPSNDYDYEYTQLRWRVTGSQAWDGTRIVTGSSSTVFGLTSDTQYDVELTSFDSLGAGGVATTTVSTTVIVAADVTGLGDWATLTDPADLAFIQENVADNAVSSDKIASLVAGKITAGAIAVQVDVGDGANRVILDGATGIVQTSGGGVDYKVTMGVHSAPSESPNPLVLSASDGDNYNFWIDSAGNSRFGGELVSATGDIENVTANNLTISGNSRFTAETPPVFTVGAGGDFDTLQEAVNYAQGFLGTGSSPTVGNPYSVGVRVLSGTVMDDNQCLSLQGRDYSEISILFDDTQVNANGLTKYLFSGVDCKMPSVDISGVGDLGFSLNNIGSTGGLISLIRSELALRKTTLINGSIGANAPRVLFLINSTITAINVIFSVSFVASGYTALQMESGSNFECVNLTYSNSPCVAVRSETGRNTILASGQISALRPDQYIFAGSGTVGSNPFSSPSFLKIYGSLFVPIHPDSSPVSVLEGVPSSNSGMFSLGVSCSNSANATETDMPIGSIISVFTGSGTPNRNASNIIRLDSTSHSYTTAGTGAIMNGEWRSRGVCDSNTTGRYTLFQRVR